MDRELPIENFGILEELGKDNFARSRPRLIKASVKIV